MEMKSFVRPSRTVFFWNLLDGNGTLSFVLQNSNHFVRKTFHLAAMSDGQNTFISITEHLERTDSLRSVGVTMNFSPAPISERPSEDRSLSKTRNRRLDIADWNTDGNSKRISRRANGNGNLDFSADRAHRVRTVVNAVELQHKDRHALEHVRQTRSMSLIVDLVMFTIG